MRRSTILQISALAIPLLALGPVVALSQTLHLGGAYSTHVEDPGIMVGGYLPVADIIEVGGEFTWFFTDDAGATSFNIFTVDINGRYPVLKSENGGPTVEVIAGLNILRWSGDYGELSPGFEFDTSGTDIGVNAGATAGYDLGSVGVFGKVHAVIGGDSSGVNFGVGVSKAL
jgi:hypothetical protein